jgi:hypothetical protein
MPTCQSCGGYHTSTRKHCPECDILVNPCGIDPFVTPDPHTAETPQESWISYIKRWDNEF